MSDGSDVLSAHRSPDGRLVVTSDEFRKVNLFRHPAGPNAAACRSTAAHAAHVPAVRFTAMAEYALNFELLVFIARPEQRPDVIDRLNTGAYKALGEANIEIPFPQQRVHLAQPSD